MKINAGLLTRVKTFVLLSNVHYLMFKILKKEETAKLTLYSFFFAVLWIVRLHLLSSIMRKQM